MDEALPRARQVYWLVGPLVTLAAVGLLLLVARHFDRLPVLPPECGFKKSLGIPCVGCGGTRAMRALAAGDVAAAAKFNPAAVAGVFLTGLWTLSGWLRYLSATPVPPLVEQNRRLKRNAGVAAVMLVFNWIYLLLYLP